MTIHKQLNRLLIFITGFSICTSVYASKNLTSAQITQKAWNALNEKNWSEAIKQSDLCIKLYLEKAKEQQTSLNKLPPADEASKYWALNDVATAYFIKAKSFANQKLSKEAIETCQYIIDNLSFAQCFDPVSDNFWKVKDASKDLIMTAGTTLDFGNYTSEELVGKAWKSFGQGDHWEATQYAKKCIQLYTKDALKMQKDLGTFADKDTAANFWALNDVGTAYFILGESLLALEKTEEALHAFEKIFNEFSFAQCFDPSGPFYWKVAKAARGKYFKAKATMS